MFPRIELVEEGGPGEGGGGTSQGRSRMTNPSSPEYMAAVCTFDTFQEMVQEKVHLLTAALHVRGGVCGCWSSLFLSRSTLRPSVFASGTFREMDGCRKRCHCSGVFGYVRGLCLGPLGVFVVRFTPKIV